MEIEKYKNDKKLTLQQQMRADTRIFNLQSRLFAGELPDKIYKNNKEVDYLTTKANDLPIIERLQEGILCHWFDGSIAKVFISKSSNRHRIEPIYRFKKIDQLKIHIRYRKGNEVEFYFSNERKRDAYFDELINNRTIHSREALKKK